MDGSAQAATARISDPPTSVGSEAELLFKTQRQAFAKAGPAGATRRRALLERLEKALLSYRAEIAHAISEDFGHRSGDETLGRQGPALRPGGQDAHRAVPG